MCGMGARKRGGRVMGRGEEGMEVLSLVYVYVFVKGGQGAGG